METTDSEIDVNQLMEDIRAAVAKREASGQRSLIGASVELDKLLNRIIEPPALPSGMPSIRLQPEFIPHSNGQYHVNDLLQYHDLTFIHNAYRAILKRGPDEPGLQSYLNRLRSGRLNKIDILASLRFSGEGKRVGVSIDGLTVPAAIRRLYRLPILGYLLETAAGIARLPHLLRTQRQLEEYLVAQQELLAERINELSETGSQTANSLDRSFSELFADQRTLAVLQRQHVVGLFREQQEIIKQWKTNRDRVGGAYPAQTNGSSRPSFEPLPQQTEPQLLTEKKRRDLEHFFVSYADQLRGNSEDVKEGLKRYLSYLESAGIRRGILDLGSGRGEWLELLKEAELEGRGVESNNAFVLESRSRGLEVVEEEALSYLSGLPDLSVNAVTGFHFIEHLTFEVFIDLLDEIKRTLRPGGLAIFETPNPKNLTVAACNFYSDPTHQRPLFPETVEAMLRHKGFEDVRVEYLNPVENEEGLGSGEWLQSLLGLVYGPRDFAVVGKKAGGVLSIVKTEEEEESLENVSELTVGNHLESVKVSLHVSPKGHEYHARPDTDDRGVFEAVVDSNEYDLPTEFNAKDVVIDIGAHIGGFSYAVLKRGVGKVYAFEAHPVNHAIARKNVERFGDKAICRNAAVWRSDQSTQTLYNADLTNVEHTGGISLLWNVAGIPVETISLDEILAEASNGFKDPIRMLKLDCEGSEYPILFTSKHLGIVKEICGEYHEIKQELIPDRAVMTNVPQAFNRHGLRDFFEHAGWLIEIEPVAPDHSLGHFHARRRKRFWQ